MKQMFSFQLVTGLNEAFTPLLMFNRRIYSVLILRTNNTSLWKLTLYEIKYCIGSID